MSTALTAADTPIDSVNSPTSAALLAVVAYARAVPSAAREAFAAELEALEPHDALIVVHTCHRVEAYVALESAGDLELPEPPPGTVRLQGAAAASHLISVACGLESAVLGEDQVMHQVRQTLARRRAAGPLDPILDRLFQVALQAGRRARDWFGGEQRSLGGAALDEIEMRTGPIEGRQVLVVGAGSMGRRTATTAVRRGARVVVTNRTEARAADLAAGLCAEVIPWGADEVPAGLVGAVVAVGGRWCVSERDAQRLKSSGATVVDLSSPPATPVALQQELGSRFISVDDLAWDLRDTLPEGLRDRLEALVSETGREYCRWLRARAARPAIREMTETTERRRRAELQWLFRRLPGLSSDEAALIEQMSHRLVGGILHGPLTALGSDDTGDLGRAACALFGLTALELEVAHEPDRRGQRGRSGENVPAEVSS